MADASAEGDGSGSKALLPIVPFLKIPEGGDPYLEGHKCGECGAVFLGERNICSSCSARDKISPEDIRYIDAKAQVPEKLRGQFTDLSYGKKQPLFRRTSGQATVTIFDGGHELIAEAALTWIQAVHREKQDEQEK